ncbi:MAG TPA: aldo/keto reductase, partial [Thermoleophilia bacterium]|nr:aldo/keto reductase [Thermoleophilia bacterium]
ADQYGGGDSERYLGRVLGERRDQVVITTKFGGTPPPGVAGGDPAYVRRACEASLRRLGTSYIDLYLLHVPDTVTPIAETLQALDDLVAAGKVREIGCSHFSAEQLADAAAAAREHGLRRFVCVQNEYNLLEREAEQAVLAAAAALDVAFVPFFPLAMGLLGGRYRDASPAPPGTRLIASGDPEDEAFVRDRLAVVERLAAFAERRGHTVLELALSWLADRPQVAAVIPGAMSPEQVAANVAAAGAWRLTADEQDELARVTTTGS